jgi:hypothetical protein
MDVSYIDTGERERKPRGVSDQLSLAIEMQLILPPEIAEIERLSNQSLLKFVFCRLCVRYRRQAEDKRDGEDEPACSHSYD